MRPPGSTSLHQGACWAGLTVPWACELSGGSTATPQGRAGWTGVRWGHDHVGTNGVSSTAACILTAAKMEFLFFFPSQKRNPPEILSILE